MNTHQFYNLLDGKVSLPYLKSSKIHCYPWWYLFRYNMQIRVINVLCRLVLAALSRMTKLEREQFNYTVNTTKGE